MSYLIAAFVREQQKDRKDCGKATENPEKSDESPYLVRGVAHVITPRIGRARLGPSPRPAIAQRGQVRDKGWARADRLPGRRDALARIVVVVV